MKRTLKIVAIVIGSCLIAGLFAGALYEIYVAVLKVKLSDIRQEETRYIAHRGLSSRFYENTAEAFEAAGLSDFFYGIETDIWRTADGQYVCTHDEYPFADASKSVKDLTLDECLDLPLKNDESGSMRLVALETYLAICLKYDKVALVELKPRFSDSELKEISQICVSAMPADKLILASFDDKNLKRLAAADAPFGLMHFQSARGWIVHNANLGYSMGVKYKALSESLVTAIHGLQVAVAVWTVDDPAEAARFAEMGVDYVITNVDLSAVA